MMKARILAAACLAGGLAWFFVGRSLWAQNEGTLRQDEAVKQLTDDIDVFLRGVAKGDVKNALDVLLETSPLAANSRKLNDLRESIRRELPKQGAFVGTEQLRLERLGRSLVRCVYLYRAQDFPVVWRFTFYRADPSSDWTLIALKFDVDYDLLSP